MLNLIKFTISGSIGGLIVASWHGFKDSPWEGFIIKRFPRSIVTGSLIGFVLYFVNLINLFKIDNLGIVVLSAICFERFIGEVIKGFIKKKNHAEYISFFEKYKYPYKRYFLKLILGIIFILFTSFLLFFYMNLPDILDKNINSKLYIGVLSGLIGGLTVAIGGALKDSPKEGFKIKKFIRSPFAGILGGILLINFINNLDLLIIAVIGFERILVEFYKSFYTQKPRGIFEGIEQKYPEWLSTRWIFFLTYSFGVLYAFIMLSLNIS